MWFCPLPPFRAVKLAEIDPSLPSLMHSGHQRVWDERAGRRKAGQREPDIQNRQQSPRVLTSPLGDVLSDEYGAGREEQGQGEASLVDLVLCTPGLCAELVPSHAALLQQVPWNSVLIISTTSTPSPLPCPRCIR